MAKEVYRFMERNGLKMDDVSYGCFLRTLCRSGHLSEVFCIAILSRCFIVVIEIATQNCKYVQLDST